MKVSRSTIFIGIGVALIAVVGIILGLNFLDQEQDTRSDAAVPGGVVRVNIDPTSSSIKVGDTLTHTVSLNPVNSVIGSAQFHLSYEFTGDKPPLQITSADIKEASTLPSGWSCNLLNARTEASSVHVEVSCLTTSVDGYTGAAFADFFTFTSKAVAPTTGSVSFRFDTRDTIVTDKTPGSNAPDIAAVPNSTASVTVTPVNGGATPTPSPAPNVTPSPTPNTNNEKEAVLSYDAPCDEDITASYKLTENDNPVAAVSVTFTYNGETKTVTSDSTGTAKVSFTAAGETALTAEATDFGKQTQQVQIEECEDDDDDQVQVGNGTCNATCVANRDCNDGFSCVDQKCRKDQCIADSTCQCSEVDVAKETGTTELPESGSGDMTLLMAITGLLFLGGGAVLLHKGYGVYKAPVTEEDIK